jgi:hypothetical protein
MSKLIPTKVTREMLGGVSQMTEWRWRADGTLPPMIKMNKRNYDLLSEIEAIILGRISGMQPDAIRAMVASMVADRAAPGIGLSNKPLREKHRKVGA